MLSTEILQIDDALLNPILGKNPSKSDVDQMIHILENSKMTKNSCSEFIKAASTAKVYRVCTKNPQRTACTDDCYAIKVSQDNIKFDNSEVKVQDLITQKTRGTEAEEHFNSVIKVLDSTKLGKIIVLRFEHPWSKDVSVLSDLLRSFDMTERLWKSINFQVLVALTVAQRKVPGFTHNDTHCDNILCVRNVKNEHICAIVSDKGRTMTNYSNLLIKIIDFGQAMTPKPQYQTTDGKYIWKNMLGNKMIDFHRFAIWSANHIQLAVEEEYEAGKRLKYPNWYTNWRYFINRWILPELMPDYNPQSNAIKFTAAYKNKWIELDNGCIPNKSGEKYLNQYYGPKSKLGLSSILDDPYFDEFTYDDPKYLKFSKGIQKR